MFSPRSPLRSRDGARRAPVILAAFAAGLTVVSVVAAFAGDRAGPAPADGAEAPDPTDAAGHMTMDAPAAGDHGAASAHPIRGLAVADSGLRVVVDRPELRRGRTETLTFRVVDAGGATVRDFDLEHERRMHLIIARRDLTGFQHLHPAQRADGAWTTPIRLDEPGSYRLFADFARDGESHTLAGDLRVDGPVASEPLPAAARTAVSDGGYDVQLDAGRVRPGREAVLRFTITHDGQPVHTQPYLGAGGHLVALREGDMAFLHVHPTGHGHDGGAAAEAHDDAIGFAATFPTAGRYRLFLQFRHDGRVHTVAFTQEAR